MPNLIILRLHPVEPLEGSDFTDYLKDLVITAYDASFDHPEGEQIGEAKYLPTIPPNPPNPLNRISQHIKITIPPLPAPPVIDLFAVATAVIEVDGPAEYMTSDIRLQITRGGKEIINRIVHYNVPEIPLVPLPIPDQMEETFPIPYSDLQNSGIYLALSAPAIGLDPSVAYVDLPADGQAPKFDDIVKAINLVLAKDPDTANADLEHLSPLTSAQSRHVAAEIIWNRTLYPPPDLPRSLEKMYTKPDGDSDEAEMDRKQFDAEHTAYHATHDAEAGRLAGFVFAASAAVACEELSAKAASAGLKFPLITGASTATTIPNTTVVLTDPIVLNPPFTVPAAYFYAIGAMLPLQVSAQQRYDMARRETESRLLSKFQTAIDAGSIIVPAKPVTVPAAPSVNPNQAARRLDALGSTAGSFPKVTLTAPVTIIVKDWLDEPKVSEEIDTLFWIAEVAAEPAAYLQLILHAVTKNHQMLIDAILSTVTNVADLVKIWDQQWRDFFLNIDPTLPLVPPPPVVFPPPASTPPRLALLPTFTQPGTPAERVEAFIRHLRKFFTVQFAFSKQQPVTPATTPTLSISITDVFKKFTTAYTAGGGGVFAFGAPWNTAAFQQALTDVFPGDEEAQAWLRQALDTIDTLYRMTDIGLPDLQFSLMEALFARGFTDTQSVQTLSQADFQEALTGSVAYPHAADIYLKAGIILHPIEPAEAGFKPINPDGSLTDCIPPLHLSPLGPVEYLHELLKASEASTCEDPMPDEVESTVAVLIAKRCGTLGDLHATRANLETPLPLIDLVNENLEALAAGLPGATGGVVYDTASDELAGHKLQTDDPSSGSKNSQSIFLHNPTTLFATLPEHSTPATPIAQPGAYDRLKKDFTSPLLPYSQPLDISRSYLRQLGTNRYTSMRTFQKDITEFVLDPVGEPLGFQPHLWRYPVRIEIAREYLDITPEEYDLLFTKDIVVTLTVGRLLLRELYGFESSTIGNTPWTHFVVRVSEFLKRTGLVYCEFIDLWKSEFVQFDRAGEDSDFPDCEPCCLDKLLIQFVQPEDSIKALKHLAVFIRLWRKLQQVDGARYTFTQLRDICEVLNLFTNGSINPDFIRQFAAFQMLRDNYRLELIDKTDSQVGGTGADRTHLLALWVGDGARKWAWAVEHLLYHIQHYAQDAHNCDCRPPEFIKLLMKNLNPLSRFSGFDPGSITDTWHANPTHTLRFTEILSKIYASDFGIGEILFLFTADDHLDGDDPFPLQTQNEALDSPLNLPDDEDEYSLWDLRRKLLSVDISDEEVVSWTWTRIEASLQEEFGLPPDVLNLLLSIGEKFFPTILEACGRPVDVKNRQYRVDLAVTSALMWNTPPDGPFRYDSAAQQLWTQLPLTDEALFAKLSRIRQLDSNERIAVRDLYSLPREDLAPFSFIFTSFAEADERLIQEADEVKRWDYFQREFVLCHARCHVIAEHLAGHVAKITGHSRDDGVYVAWRLLKHLLSDENLAKTSWESDSGQVPEITWKPQPNGGAFAALLGLTGTGLLGKFTPEDDSFIWREVRGPMDAFGPVENAWNSPIPTILPAMSLTFTHDQERFVSVRNGFAMSNPDGTILGASQGFSVYWHGVLLVENEGTYEFRAGAPTQDEVEPDFKSAEDRHWRVTLKRGQKTWILLSHNWPDEHAPAACSTPLPLKSGAYQLTVEFVQPKPAFDRLENVCLQTTGFQLKYAGPDSSDKLIAIPLNKLFRDFKDKTLGDQIECTDDVADCAAKRFLELHFTSTLRDIRRTYQRAYKALLFSHRLGLSAKPIADDGQSELGYILAHAEDFIGTSYYRSGGIFNAHHAYFDFNFLPVLDNYHPPAPAQDQRAQPSVKRRQALFDWWERIFDYTTIRREAQTSPERPVWLLFHEAAENHPDDPAHLLRHMGVDLRHATLVLKYYQGYDVSSANLEDERWSVRAWQAEKWIRSLLLHFFAKDIRDVRPDLWASGDPSKVLPPEIQSGNKNLTKFFREGCIENGEPYRYEDIKQINDSLRQRARAALLAYLCGMSRVSLPWGMHVQVARDLTDLLLQNVEAGICEKASRIEDAISAVQTFVQRARLGLEPGFIVSPAFVLLWDRRFSTFNIWEACKRREIYRENWIHWDELQKARKTEAFRFLESELRRSTLTVPVPGGMEWWPDEQSPTYSSLNTLQAREPAEIRLFPPGPVPEGLGLLGTPERDARPSWLAPILHAGIESNGGEGNNNEGIPIVESPTVSSEGPIAVHSIVTGSEVPTVERMPLWIQAAIRLGTRFIRVAAAGVPPASTAFVPRNTAREEGCCIDCDWIQPPFIDEYYFWLQDSRYFDEVSQDADLSAQPLDDPQNDTTYWHRDEKLPGLLHWDSGPMVHLFWCRFHNGEFKQPRRSDEGLRIMAGATPQLDFKGRIADSLKFEVTGGLPFPGYDPTSSDRDKSLPGFRYDMATDSTVVLPQVVASPVPVTTGFPGGLKAYPFFAYFAPGAQLEPPSMFSVAMSVAGTLRAHCRFEVALKWYELVFNPLQQDNTWAQCPDQNTMSPPNDDMEGDPVMMVMTPLFSGSDSEPCCPSAPVSDVVASDRAIMLQYLETLLQWGDALMCRNSPEVFQQATVMFNTLERVLGPRPEVLEQDDGKNSMTVAAFVPLPAPLNPRLMALYDRKSDRLALIHHCLNAYRLRNGRPNIDMPYWGNSLLHDGWKTTVHVCQDEDDWCMWCCSPYRFVFFVQKALELAGEVRGLGAELLAAYEKGDAEYLASLRTTHERQLLQLVQEVRQNQWREADWQVQALRKTKEGAQTRKRYFDTLIADGLNAGETGYEALTGVSMASRAAGNVSEAIAQGMGMVPDFWFGVAGIMGSPLEFQQLPLGNKLATGFATGARILNALAEIANTSASLSLTKGGWDRREDEWRHQVEVIGIEIEQIERQILAAERRRDIAMRELNNHQQQIEHAIEVQDFLRDKFTSHELYLFLQQETAALHYQAYELALRTARKAQRAFNYERGYTAHTFLPSDAWDNLHEGLLAGERLQLALRQMEKAYIDANCREYELTKHISLRLNFPLAFLCLKATGYCEIEVLECMFDHDYPGHYMRRIKNVTLTIPCVVGPYIGVHCRLTLLSSKTRVDPRLIDPPASCCGDGKPKNRYETLPDDPRVVKLYAATEAIATSSGQNDSGMFELDFRDERYLPFEFAGAVSRWRIELPQENNQFDVDTINDVVLHLNYTAREGGEVLRKAANEVAQQYLPGNGLRFFDIKHEFPDAWQIFQGNSDDSDKSPKQLSLRLNRNMFPFLPGQRDLEINRLELFFEATGAKPSAHKIIEFQVGQRTGHISEDPCEGNIRNIYCIASAEWPSFYHGVLDIRLGPLSQSGYDDLGTFIIPHDIDEISRAFLFCGYNATWAQSDARTSPR